MNRAIEEDLEQLGVTRKRSRNSSTRKAKQEAGVGKEVKPKFAQERTERINSSPLVPMNQKQKEYIRAIHENNLIIATGFAGTSKTYIPTVMACDAYLKGEIDRIYLTRPNISNSKSLGYFSGDLIQKASHWLGPVLSVLRDRLGQGSLELAIKHGDIAFVPFEVIKGYSFRKGTFVICDEAEDMTQEEAIKLVTRIGGCKMVLAGDVLQSELKERSGLAFLTEMVKKHPELADTTGFIDFNSPSDIVRSQDCKNWILALRREGKM